MSKGSLGFGNDYINGLWESEDLASTLHLIALNEVSFEKYFLGNTFYKIIYSLYYMRESNNIKASYSNVSFHYNLSNTFYSLWLENSMTYSAALFNGNETLSLREAQQAKYDRIFNKLGINSGESVLDIGCGWGAFAEYLAKKGVNITGITLSEPQIQYAINRIAKTSLQNKAQIRLTDYRKVTGIFDYIVSIGMFEHVGEKYWYTYFKQIAAHLRKGGKAMIQTIVIDENSFSKINRNITSFIQYYIFPGGCLPSHSNFINEAQRAGLKCNESFAFGQDYATTLKHWLTRFDRELSKIRQLGFNEQFIRCWRFYLSYARAGFLSNRINVVQFELQHN
jgi:cyclopropane-fatty-acyl-phospholipid synthase